MSNFKFELDDTVKNVTDPDNEKVGTINSRSEHKNQENQYYVTYMIKGKGDSLYSAWWPESQTELN